jgi:hypothetical protein
MTSTQPKPTTTDAGIPIENDEHSLTVAPDGPILLQDHYVIEQMANFNRERVRRSASRTPRAAARSVRPPILGPGQPRVLADHALRRRATTGPVVAVAGRTKA